MNCARFVCVATRSNSTLTIRRPHIGQSKSFVRSLMNFSKRCASKCLALVCIYISGDGFNCFKVVYGVLFASWILKILRCNKASRRHEHWRKLFLKARFSFDNCFLRGLRGLFIKGKEQNVYFFCKWKLNGVQLRE